jgi:hypothetical protein
LKYLKILTCVFSLSIFLLEGCEKDIDNPGYGKATMQLNSKDWLAYIEGLTLDKQWPDSLYSVKFSNRYNYQFNLYVGLNCVPKRTGIFQIYRDHYASDSDTVLLLNSFLYTMVPGYSNGEWWDLYEPDSQTNKLTITSFDKTTNSFSGSFQCTYIAQHPDLVTDPPETIRIKNAVFSGRIMR